jgi:phage terminase small subunit
LSDPMESAKPFPGKRAMREELFARAYIIDLNGTKAAIAAGYKKSTARYQASRMLTKSNILARIAELTKAVVDRVNRGGY